MHGVEAEGLERRDRRLVGVELRRRRENDVVDKVAAAVVVVADESGAGRNALDDLDQTRVDAMLDQAVQHDLTESVVADRADEDASPAGQRRLVDEDSGRAGGIGPGIGRTNPVPAVLGRTDELDQEIADTADFGAAPHDDPPWKFL